VRGVRSFGVAALVFMAACSGDCGLIGPSEEEQKTALIAWVQASQKEGIVDRDVDAFLRIWADDATLIAARTERPSAYDIVHPIAEVARSQRVRLAAEPDHVVRMSYRDESVHLEGDRALLRWTVIRKTTPDEGGAFVQRGAEWFRAERQGERWKVLENRFWPLESRVGDEVVEYDESYWRERDEAVEATRATGDRLALLHAQIDAHQFAPALDLARAVCGDEPENVAAWRHRAWLALLVNETDEASEAYRRYRRLDPGGYVPPWVR
jgi:hypothetical protein